MLLDNVRVFKRIHDNLADCCNCIGDIGFYVVYTFSGLEPFFRDEYNTEIKRIFSSMFYYDRGGTNPRPVEYDKYVHFVIFVKSYPEMFRHLLQHIYTSSDDGKRLYDKIKESIYLYHKHDGDHEKVERHKQLFEEFMKDYYRLKNFHTALSHPDFGACEYCVKNISSFGIRFHKIRRHKKFLKKSDPKMWDLFDI